MGEPEGFLLQAVCLMHGKSVDHLDSWSLSDREEVRLHLQRVASTSGPTGFLTGTEWDVYQKLSDSTLAWERRKRVRAERALREAERALGEAKRALQEEKRKRKRVELELMRVADELQAEKVYAHEGKYWKGKYEALEKELLEKELKAKRQRKSN